MLLYFHMGFGLFIYIFFDYITRGQTHLNPKPKQMAKLIKFHLNMWKQSLDLCVRVLFLSEYIDASTRTHNEIKYP